MEQEAEAVPTASLRGEAAQAPKAEVMTESSDFFCVDELFAPSGFIGAMELPAAYTFPDGRRVKAPEKFNRGPSDKCKITLLHSLRDFTGC